jgi:cytochrome o ubiquinol oxidase subunit 1
MGIWIGGFACLFGFAVIWHLWWLAVLAIIGVVVTLIRRTFEENIEYEVSAAEAKRHDVAALKGNA